MQYLFLLALLIGSIAFFFVVFWITTIALNMFAWALGVEPAQIGGAVVLALVCWWLFWEERINR